MSGPFCIALFAAALFSGAALTAPAAFANGIAPGLWRIVSRTETGGVIGPPHESSRCLSTNEAQDVAATFTPSASANGSSCTPTERNFNGQRLSWRVKCKGQLDMEETGDFNFDSPRHYTATMRTRAAMSGNTMIDSQDTIEGQWVSQCKSRASPLGRTGN